ncbi:MAG: tetratricopeptide repeat protein [Methylobacter sp.]
MGRLRQFRSSVCRNVCGKNFAVNQIFRFIQYQEIPTMRTCLFVLISLCLLFSGCSLWNDKLTTEQYIENLKHRAEQGDASAQFNLGYAYSPYSKGVQQDKAAAVQWYRKSAEQGYAAAQFMLGLVYEKGEGVFQDKAEAARWYSKAAGHGFSGATSKLTELKKDERIAILIAKERGRPRGDILGNAQDTLLKDALDGNVYATPHCQDQKLIKLR